MTAPPLSRSELDDFTCDECGQGCGHPIALSPRCHPNAPFAVAYREGVLVLRCASCGKPAADVLVGWRGEA